MAVIGVSVVSKYPAGVLHILVSSQNPNSIWPTIGGSWLLASAGGSATLARIAADTGSGTHLIRKTIVPNRHAKLQRLPDAARGIGVKMRMKQSTVGRCAFGVVASLCEVEAMRCQPDVGLPEAVGAIA